MYVLLGMNIVGMNIAEAAGVVSRAGFRLLCLDLAPRVCRTFFRGISFRGI